MTEINYLALALASVVFAITPGPGIVALIAVSVSRGALTGAVMSFAMVWGDMVYLVLAIISLASIAHSLEGVMLVIRIAGGLYLGWFGYRQMISPPISAKTVAVNARTLGVAAASGFMISVTNPKVIVFYLSFLPLFMDLGQLRGGQALAVPAVIFASVWAAVLVVVVSASKARKLVTGEVSGRWVNRVTGAMLILVAATLVALV